MASEMGWFTYLPSCKLKFHIYSSSEIHPASINLFKVNIENK